MARAPERWRRHLDPKVRLEHAILEAREQHRKLEEQAAELIANQKQAEMLLERSMDEREKLDGNTRQAVLMADEAAKAGDTTKLAEHTSAAESFAHRLVAVDREVKRLEVRAVLAAEASDQAEAALQESAAQLQVKVAEHTELLGRR